MDKEVWKDVKHYEGLYRVSSHGRLWSVHKNDFKSIGVKDNGYLFAQLWKNGKSRTEYVHRLVAMAFIPNPDNLPQVNHKDENKRNNYVENLEWCTGKYNINYGTTIQRIVESNRKAGAYEKNREKWKKHNPARENPKTYGKNAYAKRVVCDGREFDSIKSCAEYYGVSYSGMRAWFSGRVPAPKYFQDKEFYYLD